MAQTSTMGLSNTYLGQLMMDSVRSPRLPDLPQNIHLDLSRSQTIVSKCLIDTPKDHEQRRRERIWEFHQKNRGIMAKMKSHKQLKSEKEDGHHVDFNDTHGKGTLLHSEDRNSTQRRHRKLPKIRYTRVTRDPRNIHIMSSESRTTRKDPKDMNVTYTYSSALTIGNSIHSKVRMQDRENTTTTNDENKKKRTLTNTFERPPDLSAALTKLGYLKLARNVVHHGGGFFGRHVDKRYADIRRSFSMLESDKRQQDMMDQAYALHLVNRYGSLQHLGHMENNPLKPMTHVHSPRISEGKNKEEEKYKNSSLVVESQTQDEVRSKSRVNAGDAYRRYEEKRKKQESGEITVDHRQVTLVNDRRSNTTFFPSKKSDSIDKRDGEQKSKKNSDIAKREKTCPELDFNDRPSSNTSLDIPSEKFGPSSQLPEHRLHKTTWVYGVNPYRWTSKSSLTEEDKPWVERAMQRTEIVDKSAYDSFARTKPAKSSISD